MKHNKTQRRRGATLVMFVVLLPVLIGFVGLVIDSGMLMATVRQTQSAADAAALAAARDMLTNENTGSALDWDASARNYAQQNGMGADAGIQVNRPPQSGPYVGDDHYVEVIITNPLRTFFIQVLGIDPQQRVVARAVAGFEFSRFSDVLILLDPNPTGPGLPGLTVSGGGNLRINGGIGVNSERDPAVSTGGQNAALYADSLRVVGGVDPAGQFFTPDGAPLTPEVGQLPAPDPFLNSLHPPTTADGVPNVFPVPGGGVGVRPWGGSGDPPIKMPGVGDPKTTLDPGVYSSIQITGGNPGTVQFNPGIYVILGGGLTINNTGGQVVGNGVMFYNTSSKYDLQTGTLDNQGTFGDITINSQGISLSPYSNPGSPFDKMLIYQTPWNTKMISLQGGGSGTNVLTGGIYAKWAPLKLTGGSSASSPITIQTQIVVGSLTVGGHAVLNPMLTPTEVFEVFLVE